MIGRALFAFSLLAAPANPSAAQDSEQVRCSIDHEPDHPCEMTIALEDGVYRLTFRFDGREVTFTGRSQTGWWSGELNGRPAMGYERNRGNTVFSTRDLETVFAWWYPGMEHGSY